MPPMWMRSAPYGKAALVVSWLVACGGSPTGRSDVNDPTASSIESDLPPPLACPTAETAASATTYYVAINEPGADNAACDGRSPVNRGGGHCPFRDFSSTRTFGLLRGVAGVRVEVRAGVYTITNEGLSLHGIGEDANERIVLTAHQDEPVVFDGANIVRELVRLSGSYTTIERVTFRNSGAHHIEVRGGDHHVIQCVRFLANRSSDALKGDGGASDTLVRHNEFTAWDSQAIDLTGVHRWVIEDNRFFDPAASDGNAIGVKFGSRNIAITRNHFANTRGLAMGGVSSPHDDEFEAYQVVVEANRFEDVEGEAANLYSCSECVFRRNDVIRAGTGVFLGGRELDGPSGCPGGCRPSRGTLVAQNRLREMVGGDEGAPDVFLAAYSSETKGFVAADNLYCHSRGGAALFFYDGRLLEFSDWVATIATDSTSTAASENDAVCGF